jgi:hypothetical protein
VTALVFVAWAGAAFGGPQSSPSAQQAIAEATGAALQADGLRAVRVLRALSAEDLAPPDAAFRACMLDRFDPNHGSGEATAVADPLAREILSAFREYWRASLRSPSEREVKEGELLRTLGRLLGRGGVTDMDAIEPALQARLRQAGYYSLLGRTGLLRELMMWEKQHRRSSRVELPEGTHVTPVLLLDGFASLGWGDYATCGRRGTGGWATPDTLYAVVPRYPSLDGEEFRVTFLGHETQHFADRHRFPNLKPWELEYRAKLVELAQVRVTRERVLRKFAEDQGDDPASPHSYANKQVLLAITRRLGLPAGTDLTAFDLPRLNKAAVAELRADTSRRRRLPAGKE